jgi:hypothetical protein
MDHAVPRRKLALVVLAVVVALAFGLRWPIAHRLLPQLPEPDAFQVLHVQDWRGDPALPTNWEYAQRYPKLLTYAFAAVPDRTFDERLAGQERVQAALACASAPYQRARYVVLLLSLLALPLTWLVARRFTGEGTALVATWLVATSLLHALFSTQGRPHGVHLTASLLAIWGALRVVESPTWKRMLAATLFAALAMATLQNGAFTLAPLAAALFLAQPVWWRRVGLALAACAVAAGLAFVVYPTLPTVDASGVHLGGTLSHNVFFSDFTFEGFGIAANWFAGHDPAFAALAIVGLVLALPWLIRNVKVLATGRKPLVLVVLAYVVPYALLLCVTRDVYERFLLPLLPWLAIVAARPWKTIVDAAAASVWTNVSRAALGLVLALPLVVLARFDWVALQPDTYRQTADWIESDPARRQARIVATPGITLPFLIERNALERSRGETSFGSRPWFAWQIAHPTDGAGVSYDSLPASLALGTQDFGAIEAWLSERRPELAVIEVSRKTQMLANLRHLTEWARTHGELVYRSHGATAERMELGLADYQAIEDFARRLFTMSAFGPEIEIWRITR